MIVDRRASGERAAAQETRAADRAAGEEVESPLSRGRGTPRERSPAGAREYSGEAGKADAETENEGATATSLDPLAGSRT